MTKAPTPGRLNTVPDDLGSIVVFFAATAWDGNRFPDQHMAERLARFAPVLYVDPPRSVVRLRRKELHGGRGLASLSQIGPQLFRLSAISPPMPERQGIRILTYRLMERHVRRAVALLRTEVHAVVVASLIPMLKSVPAHVRVFYGTDDFVAGASLMGVHEGWLRRREREQLRTADVVIAVSEPLRDKWTTDGQDVRVIPNGVDERLFLHVDSAPWPEDVHLARPIAGFLGHMSDRIDLSLLEAVAASGHSLLLVGPRQATFAPERMTALLSRRNVQWVGPKSFTDLPSYVRAMDLGLVPYADTQFNRASFPLKTLEYLAAGRPTVATGLPAIQWLDTELIDVASTPRSFAAEVTRLMASPRLPEEMRVRQAFAAQHSWTQRSEDFARAIGLSVQANGREEQGSTTSQP